MRIGGFPTYLFEDGLMHRHYEDNWTGIDLLHVNLLRNEDTRPGIVRTVFSELVWHCNWSVIIILHLLVGKG